MCSCTVLLNSVCRVWHVMFAMRRVWHVRGQRERRDLVHRHRRDHNARVPRPPVRGAHARRYTNPNTNYSYAELMLYCCSHVARFRSGHVQNLYLQDSRHRRRPSARWPTWSAVRASAARASSASSRRIVAVAVCPTQAPVPIPPVALAQARSERLREARSPPKSASTGTRRT